MLRKLTTATAVAGIALGAILAASPASAGAAHGSHGGDQQYNQNLQLVPVQLCNTELVVGLLAGVNVPVLSPQTTGDCINGPVSTNID
ncbi:hypothetical protein [Nocardiopsis sp. HUAS JQ3]|uniref:hypothetical protein n=1 Tax=Nocardiopsis sp. HUAS JQ3 TaxID=3061629 RepID=UPI0023A92ED2|nr:hypothetical protein [Nocardiopsis sp. HUAS JQ3]WDZ91629.1 hypothetical protein PV789_03410 [Nocardiopsis sp. HUAS JQ3]